MTTPIIVDCAVIPSGSPLEIEKFVEAFLSDLDVKDDSKKVYRRQLKQFVLWATLKYSMDSSWVIGKNDIIDYRNALTIQGKSINTINGYMSAVSKFFKWLEQKNMFPDMSKGVRSLKRPKGFRKDCLTVEQIKQALNSFDMNSIEGVRDFAIFNLIVRTGLRTTEVAKAKVEDIRQISGETILDVQGKGRDSKDDFVLLVPETLKPIRDYLKMRGTLKPRDALFASRSNRNIGQSIEERSIRRMVKNVLKSIGIDDLRMSAHSLRHTAVSLSISNGATLVQAQAMARHNDPKTTMIYFHNHDRIKSGAERCVKI